MSTMSLSTVAVFVVHKKFTIVCFSSYKKAQARFALGSSHSHLPKKPKKKELVLIMNKCGRHVKALGPDLDLLTLTFFPPKAKPK